MNKDLILAASTSAYGKYSLIKAVEGIVKAGYKYIEIACTDGIVQHVLDDEMNEEKVSEISNLLYNYDLGVYAFSAHTNFTTPKEFEKRFLKRLWFAKKIGAQAIVTNIPSPHDQLEFIKSIKNIIPFGEEISIKICLESPGHLFTSVRKFIEILERVNSPIVYFTYDVGNVFTASLGKVDPAEELSLALHSNKLALIHLKDVSIDGGLWRFTPLGKGQINFNQIFSEIRKQNYNGPLTLEMPLFLEGKGNEPAYIAHYSHCFEVITEQLYDSRLFIEKNLCSQKEVSCR